jgi:hypothetical protein
MAEEKLEAAVGMSRKWDARKAGKEVARSTIEKLSKPPDFFLLFSTIHYEKHGGFEEFLNGVWDVLPEGTPLVGGTVVGFVNNYGCYARGTSALAVSYSNIDVALGFGKNTKRSPKKAARQCTQMINKGLGSSVYENRFLLNFISGAGVMKIPGQGYKKVIDSGLTSKFIMQAFGISQYLLQKGLGREDEIFEEVIEKLPDYHMILGTSLDDYKGMSNYQFFNKKILTNSVVNLGIATDLNLDVCTSHGMKKTDTKFEITKLSKNKHIIHEINDKPAVPELYKLLNWPEGFLNDKTIFNITPYYPISPRRHGQETPIVMPGILGDSILIPCTIDDGEVSIFTVSGSDLVNAMKENLRFHNSIQPEFGLSSTCMTILNTLGYKMNILRDEMLDYFKEKPFLMFLSAGEGTYSPTKDITYANMSINTAVFGHKIEIENTNDFSL